MIKSIKITGIKKYKVDDTTRKYALKKIGSLDRYLPRHALKNISAEIKLQQIDHDHGDKYEAEFIINIPNKKITAKGTALTMLMAIDAVEAKTQTQLRDYKQITVGHIGRRGIMSRFKRSFKREL